MKNSRPIPDVESYGISEFTPGDIKIKAAYKYPKYKGISFIRFARLINASHRLYLGSDNADERSRLSRTCGELLFAVYDVLGSDFHEFLRKFCRLDANAIQLHKNEYRKLLVAIKNKPTPRAHWYRMLKWYAGTQSYQSGWVARAYYSKWGEWPNDHEKGDPMEPSSDVMVHIRKVSLESSRYFQIQRRREELPNDVRKRLEASCG